MIKLIIFDLDGVLVDTKTLHYEALNLALKKCRINYQISLKEHLQIFDGLPTKNKLEILQKKEIISSSEIKSINIQKQKFTNLLISKKISYSKKINKLFKKLSQKYDLAIATNSVRKTLNFCIKKLKIKKYVKYYLSAEDVKYSKPHPEIYMKIMLLNHTGPTKTLIVEDSYYGRLAAKESGANLMPIKKIFELNLKNIKNALATFNENKSMQISKVWNDPNINILIPMAGKGSRFVEAGYTFPKPLIEIDQKPMIQWVVENLKVDGNFIFIINEEHQKKYNIKSLLKILRPKSIIIEVKGHTEGAACTTLLAKKYINSNKPLLIANSDQYINWDSSKVLYKFETKSIDGGILTFESIHPKWSYALTDNNGYVLKVAEKEVISNNATVGIYYWKKGSDYVKYANSMIKKNIRTNNEFYVCPVFNEAILDRKKIIIEKVNNMYGLGTPEDLNFFLQNKNLIKNT